MEENAEEFVRSYVKKGGQGWSDFFTPEFYVAAATGGVLGGLAYDEFKAVVFRIVRSVRKARGESEYDPFTQVSEHYEESIQNAWKSANRLVKKQGIEHSIDEAIALHWTLFTKELERSAGTVRLGSKRHKRLTRAANREDLSPSQLAARIIDQWLETHELCSQRSVVRVPASMTKASSVAVAAMASAGSLHCRGNAYLPGGQGSIGLAFARHRYRDQSLKVFARSARQRDQRWRWFRPTS